MTARLDITLAQLECLVAAVDAGSMTAGADALHMTQSNLSVAIAKLERSLGATLLIRRRTRGVVPTAEGEAAVRSARSLLEAARGLQEDARADAQEITGTVRLGCFVPLTPFYVPWLVGELAAHAPGIELVVREAPLDELHRAVADGELDLALGYDQQLPAGLVFRRMAYVRPYVLVSERSPLRTAGDVSLAELVEHPMVAFDLPFTLDRTRRIFAAANLPVPGVVRATTIDSVRALVAGGLGFALLNQRWATDITADGSRVASLELRDRVEPLELGVIVRPGPLAARITRVAAAIAEHAIARHPDIAP